MALDILGKKDKDKKNRKDKRRRRRSSSSQSSSKETEDPEVTQEEIEEQLQIQLSLKPRHLKLKSAVRYEDLTCVAGLHFGYANMPSRCLHPGDLICVAWSWSLGTDLLPHC